jgi:hypothetical protein
MVPNQTSSQHLFLHIGTDTIFKTEYVYWTSQGAFDDALDKVCAQGGTYKIKVLLNPDARPISNYHPCLTTTKITKSMEADYAATEQSAANDPNVTTKIAAAKADGVTAVLGALQDSTP